MGATSSDSSSKDWSHYGKNLSLFEAHAAGFLESFLAQYKCCVPHLEPKDNNTCNGNALLQMLQSTARSFYLQGRWWPPFWGMINYCLLSLKRLHHQRGVLWLLADVDIKKGNFKEKQTKGVFFCTKALGCYAWRWLWICWSLSLFPWFSIIYHLFPNMKRHLAENKYSSNKDVISAIGDFLINRSAATQMEEMCGSEEDYVEKIGFVHHIPWKYLGQPMDLSATLVHVIILVDLKYISSLIILIFLR